MAENTEPKNAQPGEKEPGTFHYDPGKMSGEASKLGVRPGTGQSGSEAIENVDKRDSPPDGSGQTFKELAQQARRDAEGTGSVSEQARLNKHADDLDTKATAAQQKQIVNSARGNRS